MRGPSPQPLGHDEQKPEAGPVAERSSVSTTPASFTEGTSIFVRAPSIEIRTGTIFKSRRESGGPAHLELAGIQGSSEGLVAPPSTPKAGPTTGFLPIVQAPAETFSISVASQRPTSEEGYSETLEVLPAMMVQPPPPSAMPVTSTRTYLVPWHVNADPEVLARMLNWVLQTLVLPDDSVKLLISGELPGIEAVEGYISHLITNDYYLKVPRHPRPWPSSQRRIRIRRPCSAPSPSWWTWWRARAWQRSRSRLRSAATRA